MRRVVVVMPLILWTSGAAHAAAEAAAAASTAEAAADTRLRVVGAEYRADTPFPQFLPLWLEGWARREAAGEPAEAIQADVPSGGNVHVFLQNEGTDAREVSDVLLDGVSLEAVLTPAGEEVAGHRPASVRLTSRPAAEHARLIAAGEPVWWKTEPTVVPPGGFAEVLIRLRRDPQGRSLPVRVVTGDVGVDACVEIGGSRPQIASIACTPARDAVTLYLRRPEPTDIAVARCRVDGRDVTPDADIPRPSGSDTLPVHVRLPEACAAGSFHLFEVEYSDGATARAGGRLFGGEFVYGMWGYSNAGETPEERARRSLTDMAAHHINVHMGMGGAWGPFIESEAGEEFLATIGMRRMVTWVGNARGPVYYFLMDEPDAQEYRVDPLPPAQRLGTLAQSLVRHSAALRRRDPATPQLLNIDNTYKPENWYTYGQLPDVLATDPYYQEQLAMVYATRPGWRAAFVKPTMVYATAVVCHAAAAPRPVHVILNAVRHDHPDAPFRFASAAEKRIELYYAIAGGARGISYWWYTPYGEYYGVGGAGAEAGELWREIGLLGAEVRTAGPLLARSCPAHVRVEAPPRLWVRTLLAGTDTLIVIVVNDNVAVERGGTVACPVEKAAVTVHLPAWLEETSAFEVTYKGLSDVRWTQRGGVGVLDLGAVELTRLVVVTRDARLRATLEMLYRERFQATAAQLLAPR